MGVERFLTGVIADQSRKSASWVNYVCTATERFSFLNVHADLNKTWRMSFSSCSTFCEFISLWHLCIWLLGSSFLRNGHLSVSWQCLRKFKQQSRGIDWLFQFLLNFFRARSYLALFSSFLSPAIPTRGCIIFLHVSGIFVFSFHPTTHSLEKVQ